LFLSKFFQTIGLGKTIEIKKKLKQRFLRIYHLREVVEQHRLAYQQAAVVVVGEQHQLLVVVALEQQILTRQVEEQGLQIRTQVVLGRQIQMLVVLEQQIQMLGLLMQILLQKHISIHLSYFKISFPK
jgi:hypothetical protein